MRKFLRRTDKLVEMRLLVKILKRICNEVGDIDLHTVTILKKTDWVLVKREEVDHTNAKRA